MNSKILLLSIAMFGMMLISIPANAESSDISVTNTTSVSYQLTANQNALSDFTTINVDSGDYNHITELDLNTSMTAVSYPTNGNATNFHITSCGSGFGSVTYSGIAKIIVWYFSPNTTITCSPLHLAYDTPIFDNIANIAFPAATTVAMSPGSPAALNAAGGNSVWTGSGGTSFIYSAIMTNSVTNHYDIAYSSNTSSVLFTTTITKKGYTTVNTKVLIENATGTPVLYPFQGDSTVNNNNFSVINVYGQGIALNMSTALGDYKRVIINTTGSTVPPSPTPAPTPPPIPNGQSAAIAFDSNVYNIGATGTITTNQSFGIFDINSYRVDFYSTSNPLINQFPLDKSQTTQSFGVQFPTADTYTANIVKTVPFFGDSIIANATANAVKGTGSLSVPITVAVGKNFSVNYTLNYPAQANNMCGLGGTGIFAIFQADGSIQAQLYLLNSNQLTQGTTFKVNMSVPKAGTYILQLRDCSNGVVATSIPFNAVQSSVPPEFNISFSYINLTTETIYSGDVITGIWGVDNANYSAFPIYYELQNYSTGTILRIPLTGQKGTISQITTGYDLIHLMSVTGLIPAGLNKVSLRADTGNGGTELAFENFTFSRLTASGYDVSVDVSCVKPGEVINIHAIVPSGTQSAINIRAASDVGGNGTTIFISNSTTVQAVTNSVDEYIVSILDGNNNLQKTVFFTSTYLCSGGLPSSTSGTPTPTTTQSPVQAATDIIGVLGNVAFYGFVLWLGILGVTIRTMTRNGGSVSGTGLVFVMWMASVFISIIGLFGEFKIYVLIISTIIAAIIFMIGRKATTEGEQ